MIRPRLRRSYGQLPLRVRLVAALLLLVVLALLGSGVATTTIMRSYLEGRVDAQLRVAAQHPTEAAATDPGAGRGRNEHGHTNGLSAFVVQEVDASGSVVYTLAGDLTDPSQPLPQLPHRSAAQTASAGTEISTVPAVQGGAAWRLLTTSVTLTDGTTGTLFVAQSLGDVGDTVGRMMLTLLVIGAVVIVLLAGLGYVLVRASLRPLRDVELTAAAIAAGDLTRRVPHTDERTEIGQLSGALNTMLMNIETAFAQRAASEQAARHSEEQMRVSEANARRSEEQMRRFVADASHELRTPLTSIRGFSELYRQGAASSEQDIARVMQRIEDEAKRMGLLVEDLLLLARLDRQRPLQRKPVDLLALAGDAVHDARAVAPARRITLEVGSAEPPPVVLGDEARLHQVFANLLANAVQHTPDGTPITVHVATSADPPLAPVMVVDHGAGIAPEDAARIFERFYRADPSRSRDDGGTGLGLAIVAALVAGHGGTVSVDTGPDTGARFTVQLPLAD